jgi:hypothetical protein
LRPSLESIKWLFPQENSSLEDRKIEINTTGDNDIFVEAIVSEIYGIGYEKSGNTEEEEDLSVESEYARSGINLDVFSTAPFYRQRSIFDDKTNPAGHRMTENFQFWEDERFVQQKRSRDRVLFNHAIVYPSYSSSDVVLGFRLTQITKEGEKSNLLEVLRLFDPEILDIHILSTSSNRLR